MAFAMSEVGSSALLDERLLRLFDVLYATRSVSKAAAALGQAQPTVSIWLRRLREELKDPLFVRTPSGMAPTPRADELIGTVRSAMELLQKLTQAPGAYDPTMDSRFFRICMTDASHITLLPRLLAELRDQAPNARLGALPISEAAEFLLQSGEADLALGRIPALEAGFYQQTLYSQDFVCLVRLRGARMKLTVADYEKAAHVAIAGGTAVDLLTTALTELAISRRVVLELPGFLGLGTVIAHSDLMATLPRHIGDTLAAANSLRVLECPFPIPAFPIKQHWHSRYHHDPANQWLRTTCARLFQERRPRRGPAPSGRVLKH
jgi:DNA-binding transcriptional LysR family regulator